MEIIYFIASKNSIKIGTTTDLNKRMRHLQTSSPYKLILLGTEVGGRKREKELHNMFSMSHMYGEFYDASDVELIDYINSISDKYVYYDVQKDEVYAFKKMKR